jgi:predicted transposase/invertase (TIGR01784 family)
MGFADLKNDFVFRRIFARRPDLLQALLNDLLDRRGQRAIEHIDYLPSEQLPLVAGAKLSILDVRCRDRSGTTFVVEMQLLHVNGFGNRVVYNACKAYVDQLREGEPYTRLADVVAISICDFALWPDAQQDAVGQPRVPMLSRWNMTERASGAPGLLQVQYAFLELPKLGASPPPLEAGPGWWAWLFVHAPELKEVPAGLPEGAYREALQLANEATFTTAEQEAYRRARDEIQQARDYGIGQRAEGKEEGRREGKEEGRREGKEEGLREGKAEGLRAAVLDLCELLGIEPIEAQRARLAAMGVGELEALRTAIKQSKRWPSEIG